MKDINAAVDMNSINTNIYTKYLLVDNRSVTFTRLSLPFLRPTFFYQKSDGIPKTLGTLVPLSHNEDTVSRQ